MRAAERAAGGRVGSISSIGGQSRRMKFSPHFSAYSFWKAYISGNFLPVSQNMAGKGTWPKNAFFASQSMTLESLPSDQSMPRRSNLLNASRRM